MNFKKLYKRFYTVRLSLFIITFIITVALLIMSVNFWLEVNSTRKYAKLAIDNSVLQEKINTLYNLLSLEKINMQYVLSISSKSINIPSKERKEIKENNEKTNLAYNEFLSEIKKSKIENINKDEFKELDMFWSKYIEVKENIEKTIGRVITLRGTTAARGQNKNKNPAKDLMGEWLSNSNNISMQLLAISEKLDFRPERLVRSIEDLQRFKNLLLRYNEYTYREQAILAGVISIDSPISRSEFNSILEFQNIEKETMLTIKKRLARSLEINQRKKNVESKFYSNFANNNYFENNLI